MTPINVTCDQQQSLGGRDKSLCAGFDLVNEVWHLRHHVDQAKEEDGESKCGMGRPVNEAIKGMAQEYQHVNEGRGKDSADQACQEEHG